MKSETKGLLYSSIAYISLSIVAAVAFVSQVIIESGWGPKGEFALLTGQPRIVVSSDSVLHLRLLDSVNRLKLIFRHSLRGVQGDRLELDDFHVEQPHDDPRSLLFVSVIEGVPTDEPRVSTINLESKTMFGTLTQGERVLELAIVNGETVSGQAFFDSYVDADGSTLAIYYPRSIPSISTYLANEYGWMSVSLVASILSILAVLQFWLLVSTDWWRAKIVGQDDSTRQYEHLTYLDEFSSEYAIPLGLFGTIGSIWVALEAPTTTFEGFDDILAILQIAVFTTVLGFFVKLLCQIRSKLGRRDESA